MNYTAIGPIAPTVRETYSVWAGPDGFHREKGPNPYRMPDGRTFADFVRADMTGYPVLGIGFTSTVYKLTFPESTFVLKKIHKNYNPAAVDREISILMELHANPYVNRLIAAQVESDVAYILLEFVPGQTLEQWLDRKPTAKEKADMCTLIQAGVRSIHDAGIVHSDIKPDNIWVSEDKTRPILFIDFGFANKENAIERWGNRNVRITRNRNRRALNNMLCAYLKGGARKKMTQRRRRSCKQRWGYMNISTFKF